MISTADISSPTNPKHIIHIKLFDRKIFYTLSKLLPEKKVDNYQHLAASPTYSGMSSVSSSSSPPLSSLTSNSTSKLSESLNRLANNLADNMSTSISTNTSPESQFSSSSSNSSLSMPQSHSLSQSNDEPLNNANNKMDFFAKDSIVRRNFEALEKPLLSKQRTVK